MSFVEEFRSFKPTGEDLCCPRQGHRVLSNELATAFEHWLEDRDEWGVQGMSLEFNAYNGIGRSR